MLRGRKRRTTQLPGLIREPFRLAVTLPDGTHTELEALLTVPIGPGAFRSR